jgi:4-hydroxymandelate oxidase
MPTPTRPLSPEELETRAREILDPGAFDYIAGAAEDEITLRANRLAFERWRFRPRVLRGVADPDLGLELLGQRLSLPVVLAPVAVQRLAHPLGEIASATAAARAGTMFCLSTLSSRSIEEVAGCAAGPRWFQLYMLRDRGLTAELVDRAAAAGYSGLALTVDLTIVGRRERDDRRGFALPPDIDFANLAGPDAERPDELSRYASSKVETELNWTDLDWLLARSRLPVLIKGVVRGDDAARAVAAGVAAVIVSNHGGRQLDRGVTGLDALGDVLDAVGADVPVLVDGGIRRGGDVLVALCLGARAVLIGRQYVWALAGGGEAGVLRMLDQLRAEMMTSMILLGAAGLGELSPDLLFRAV